jgi:hypothetical protein
MSVHRLAGQRYLPHLAGALAFLVLLLAGVASLHAQLSTQATITGTVTDPKGLVVSGAAVTLTDDATNVSTVTKTNSDGVYIVRDLGVATYTVAITKPGFKTYTVSGVELHPTETVTVNATLAIGAETQNVTVNAVSTEVETTTPEVSADVSSEEVSTLPMNGRNYQALAVMIVSGHRRPLHQQRSLHQRFGCVPQLLRAGRRVEREHRQHDCEFGGSESRLP